MKRRLISLALVVVMMISFSIPAFAAAPSTMVPDKQVVLKAELRNIIAGQTGSVTNFVLGLVDDNTVKDLIKGAITDLIDFSDVGSIGSALGDLIGSSIGDAIGVDIPDSIDVGGIVNGIIANEIVNAILTSDFFIAVVDKTIDNLIDAIDMNDVANILTEGMIDQLTEEIWNNGNPQNFIGLGPLGYGAWNNGNETWNSGGITTIILVKLGSSAIGGSIEDYVDVSNIDFMSILPQTDVILDAIWNAIIDTAFEYYEVYKAELISLVELKINEKIDGLADAAREFLVCELNKILPVVIEAKDTLQDIREKVEIAIDCYNMTKEQIENALQKLQGLKAQIEALPFSQYKVDACVLLNSLIEKCKNKCGGGDTELEPTIVGVSNAQFISIVETQKNSRVWVLSFSVTITYSDGETEVVQYAINLNGNNANLDGAYIFGGDHDLAGYTLVYDLKGNGSNIKAFGIS